MHLTVDKREKRMPDITVETTELVVTSFKNPPKRNVNFQYSVLVFDNTKDTIGMCSFRTILYFISSL